MQTAHHCAVGKELEKWLKGVIVRVFSELSLDNFSTSFTIWCFYGLPKAFNVHGQGGKYECRWPD
jgi:hypothetical protein